MTIALTEKGERMMATCKDCVHYECCSTFESLAIRIILCGENADKRCGIFKNKADYAEVKHGMWLHKNGETICSVCGGEALMDEVYYKSPFCPDCGAKIDGGIKC